MPDPEPGVSTVVILLAAATGLLFILLLTTIGIRNRLSRIERLLAPKKEIEPARAPLVEVDSNSGGVFETFLEEDPARKNLSKKEQAAAYRQWRQEKGMNWSNS